jgi:ribonuclease HI
MNENRILKIYTDGGARGNPGPAAYGFVIFDEHGSKIYEEGKPIGINTNNVAEYSAVIAALKYLSEQKSVVSGQLSVVNFFMDSKLVTEQLSGRWKIKNETLRSSYFTIRDLEQKIGAKISYTHVFREQNKEADRLVNATLDKII